MNKSAMKTVIGGAAVATLALMGMPRAHALEPVAPYVGPYIGASVLQSHFDSHHFSVNDVDNKDTSWKIDAGMRFMPNFALEGDYTKFGKSQAPSASVGGPFVARAHSWSAFALGIAPIGPVDLYAKAGAARIKADGNVGAVFFNDNQTVFAYGAGAQLNLGRLGVRAEYEKFNTDIVGDLDIISVGLSVSLGAPRD